ncbi:MAG: hypothetical protein ACOYNN_00465 [Terrimicrobiaceae bacterium]|jgi:hypothetical protein
MEIKHITSDSLRRLLSLTEKKDQLIKAVADVENEIVKTLKGAGSTAVSVAKSVNPFSGPVKAKAGRKAKTSKSSKSAPAGSLKDRILDLLDAAGAEGLRVKEIAEKLGAKTGNISVWFSTTGKKVTSKVEPGRYAKKDTAKTVASPASSRTAKVAKPAKAVKPAKPAKKKRNLSPEARAKLAASMKARWAARKAGKPAKSAKK